MSKATKKKDIAETILQTLESQMFADFYRRGEFFHYITRYEPKRVITKKQMLEKIRELFNLED